MVSVLAGSEVKIVSFRMMYQLAKSWSKAVAP